jgi:hypothetical protein
MHGLFFVGGRVLVTEEQEVGDHPVVEAEVGDAEVEPPAWYFWRATISIRDGRNSTPAAMHMNEVGSPLEDPAAPMAAITARIGMARIRRKADVSRLRGSSG